MKLAKAPLIRSRKLQSGVGLIEVLVAILILAIGALGTAMLQLNGVKYNRVAMTHSQAAYLAYQIADCMRANRSSAMSGSYDVALGFANPTGSTTDKVDLKTWRAALATLPSGTGSISRSGNVVTITVQWDESGLRALNTSTYTAQTAQTQQFVFQTEL